MKMFPHIGVISEGTLRSQDLLTRFREILLEISGMTLAEWREVYPDWIEVYPDENSPYWQGADQWERVELATVLEGYAPPGLYFGRLEGDGACFGFFVDHDYIESSGEVEKVGDPSELDAIPRHISEALYVNDHGNLSFYVRDYDGWHLLWNCV